MQVAMRRDLAELEELCGEVQALQKAAKLAYEEVLAYFGETTNSTPSGNRAELLFIGCTMSCLAVVACAQSMRAHIALFAVSFTSGGFNPLTKLGHSMYNFFAWLTEACFIVDQSLPFHHSRFPNRLQFPVSVLSTLFTIDQDEVCRELFQRHQ
jgi:hypothetical protein